MNQNLPKTYGELKKSGWQDRSVRDEMRENLIQRINSNEPIFPGIVGFDSTVVPQLINAVLSRHHFILLGLRGQAKTRIIRQLYTLLDEWQPAIEGSYLQESPERPISPRGKQMKVELGDKMPIAWRHRSERFNEKLATPDVSIADLIGDIDPIKAARDKLDISNEEVIHWGIIPRTNRGIFAINELPDLQPRIQVGLLNILEENDIQVRGFPLRVPLDICMVFTANPEDYTNRGNIITPLKDRIDSQVITHYPRTLAEARQITAAEARQTSDKIEVPEVMRDIIEEVTFQARQSEYVDQASGVSARVSISALENFMSNIERRALANRDNDLFPRMCDVYAIIPAVTGKIELVYEGEQEGPSLVARNLIGQAIKTVFERHFPRPEKDRSGDPDGIPAPNPYEAVTDFFSSGKRIELSDNLPLEEYTSRLKEIAGLEQIAERAANGAAPRERLMWMELVLEGLYHNNLIAREEVDSVLRYADVFSDMLRGMGDES